MQIRYYAETDTLYIALREAPSVDSEEIRPGFVLDFDAEGTVVGIEIEDASATVDLTRLQSVSLPENRPAVHER